MIGDYIKDPFYGLGKVIKFRPGSSELVYFFKANENLHDGAIEPGSWIGATMVGGLALTTLKE